MFEKSTTVVNKVRVVCAGAVLSLAAVCGSDADKTEFVVTYDRESPVIEGTSSTTEADIEVFNEYEHVIIGHSACTDVRPGEQLAFDLDGTYVHVTSDGIHHPGKNTYPLDSVMQGIDLFCNGPS